MKKTRAMAIVLCGAWVAAAAAAVDLVNPSFEESTDPGDPMSDVAAGWGRWGNWINRETGWSPTKSGECLIGYHHFRIEDGLDSGIYQDVDGLAAGKHCTFSIYAFKDSGTKVEEIELRLEPEGGGQAISSQRYTMGNLKQGKWTQLTVSGVASAGGVRVLVIVRPKKDGPRDGALKFDDAQFMHD